MRFQFSRSAYKGSSSCEVFVFVVLGCPLWLLFLEHCRGLLVLSLVAVVEELGEVARMVTFVGRLVGYRLQTEATPVLVWLRFQRLIRGHVPMVWI